MCSALLPALPALGCMSVVGTCMRMVGRVYS